MSLDFQNAYDYTNGMMKYGMTKPELVMAEVEYLKWAGETIKEQQAQIAALVEALKATQELLTALILGDVSLSEIEDLLRGNKQALAKADEKPSSIDITTWEE